MKKTPEERFWEKVDKSGGPDACWPWKAGTVHGYGQFALADGRSGRAHRVAYELVKGPIPAGLDVLHDCDFPPCCNASHLWPGTQLDNRRDCVAKGRTACGDHHGTHTHPERVARGERAGLAKLTETQVREVRQMFEAGNSKTAIAHRMGVDRSTVYAIVRGETWSHVS